MHGLYFAVIYFRFRLFAVKYFIPQLLITYVLRLQLRLHDFQNNYHDYDYD